MLINDTFLVIPCYNESRRLPVEKFIAFAKRYTSFSFIFVNDGSTDSTQELIDRIVLSVPGRIISISHKSNRGKGEAVRSGILKAISMGAKVTGYWDADLSAPLNCSLAMLERFDKRTEIVMGSRVQLLGYRIIRSPIRHYAGRIFATAASMVLCVPVYDTQCGAKLFRVNDKLRKAFAHPFSVKWSFDVEVLGRLQLLNKDVNAQGNGLNAIEHPLETWIHQAGSKVKATDFIFGLLDLLKLRLAFKSQYYHSKFLDYRTYNKALEIKLSCHTSELNFNFESPLKTTT